MNAENETYKSQSFQLPELKRYPLTLNDDQYAHKQRGNDKPDNPDGNGIGCRKFDKNRNSTHEHEGEDQFCTKT
jgi:hypothetical protein